MYTTLNPSFDLCLLVPSYFNTVRVEGFIVPRTCMINITVIKERVGQGRGTEIYISDMYV